MNYPSQAMGTRDTEVRTSTRRRAFVAALLAFAALAVGARGVAVDFRHAREQIVTSDTVPDDGPRITRVVPVSARPLSVVVVRARGGQGAAPLEVRVDGRLVESAELRPGQTRRIDVQVPEGLRAGQHLELSCAAAGWTLGYLEAANLHGFSSGLLTARFVPASRHDYTSPPAWLLAVLGVALFTAWTPAPAGSRVAVRLLGRAGAILGLLFFALVLVAPVVSNYAIILSVPTFLLCLVLVFGGSVRRRYLAARDRLAGIGSRAAHTADAVVVIGAICAFFVAATRYGLAEYQGDYARLLHLSDRFVGAPVLNDYPQVRRSLTSHPAGYDGQFMYLMAFDPLLTRLEPARYLDVVDSPPYRYGRIGFSVLTRLCSGADPASFPRTMIWLIVAGNMAAAFFLVMIARHHGASPWQALPYVLIPGFLVSLGNALPESIAAAFLLGGLWAHRRSRTALAIAFWALSLMVRETGVILIVAIALFDWFEGTSRRRAASLLVALLPAVLWRAYVGFRLAPAFGWRAWWSDPSDLTWPLAGFIQLWSINDAAHGHGQAFNVWFPVLLVALLVLAVALFRARRTAVAAAAAAYALLAVSLNYEKIWSWVGNGERGTYEAFLLALVAAFSFGTLPRGLRWALAAFGVALVAYDFQIGTHATWFRAALIAFG